MKRTIRTIDEKAQLIFEANQKPRGTLYPWMREHRLAHSMLVRWRRDPDVRTRLQELKRLGKDGAVTPADLVVVRELNIAQQAPAGPLPLADAILALELRQAAAQEVIDHLKAMLATGNVRAQ
jgi:hypothetical protein